MLLSAADVKYEMVIDQEHTSVPIFLAPNKDNGKLSQVARRFTVLRCTDAQNICFGTTEHQQQYSKPGVIQQACSSTQMEALQLFANVWIKYSCTGGEAQELHLPL